MPAARGLGPFRGTQKGQRQKHTKGKATSEGILAPGPRARGVCLHISMFAYDRRLRQAQPRRSFAWLYPTDLTGPPATPLLLQPVSEVEADFRWSITVSRSATEATRSISERCAMPSGRDASDSCFAWKLAYPYVGLVDRDTRLRLTHPAPGTIDWISVGSIRPRTAIERRLEVCT